jgi:ABC-type bacteriocin/lantibiotic exporter with double-glycine peptidase domain
VNWILKDFSTVIPAGRKIVVQGASGSGKSTMLKLIFRFFSCTQGKILLQRGEKENKENKGVDILSFPVENLREHVVYLHQNTHLFPQTIMENILFGNPDSNPKDVKDIIQKYDFTRVIGTDFTKQCGNEGKNLSLGMQKIIILLRCLLRCKSPSVRIILLDEPFAGLDEDTRNNVCRFLHDWVSKEQTMILSNHVPLNSLPLKKFHLMDNLIEFNFKALF